MSNAKEGLRAVFAFIVMVLLIIVVSAVLLTVTEEVKDATPLTEGSAEYNISQSITGGAQTAFNLVGAVLLILFVGVILSALGITFKGIIGESGL